MAQANTAASTTDVTFWRQLNGTIVAQQGDEFFSIPPKSGMGEDKDSQQLIADNFASAPMKSRGMDINGAEVIATITPAH